MRPSAGGLLNELLQLQAGLIAANSSVLKHGAGGGGAKRGRKRQAGGPAESGSDEDEEDETDGEGEAGQETDEEASDGAAAMGAPEFWGRIERRQVGPHNMDYPPTRWP